MNEETQHCNGICPTCQLTDYPAYVQGRTGRMGSWLSQRLQLSSILTLDRAFLNCYLSIHPFICLDPVLPFASIASTKPHFCSSAWALQPDSAATSAASFCYPIDSFPLYQFCFSGLFETPLILLWPF